MIKQLTLRNFTVFKEADLQFSPGLNVIIGENGTGKTHLLKLAYIFSNAWHHLVKDKNAISEQKVERYFSERLQNIFKPDKVGSLSTSGGDGKSRVSASVFGSIPTVSIKMPYDSETLPVSDETIWQFMFSNRSIDNVALQTQERLTGNAIYGKGVYLPSKEMISFFEGFLAAYENREFQFDETYRDLALHLSANKLKKPPAFIKQELKTLSTDVGGTLKLEGGKFYLVASGSKAREITLVAEGIRKIATLLHLLENGSLEDGDTLFWDEPESNLNPKLIKDVAAALLFLCQNGIQVIIGTHSLFLLREIEILTSQKAFKAISQRYFALGKDGDGVTVQQSNAVDDINPFVMLDEELAQSDRFMDAGND
jgi:energy-coupling factor transporter ATP-binding protein EcfA2